MQKLLLFICVYFAVNNAVFSQWTPINPGAGGQVQDVVADPNAPNTLYMASDMEGLYKSTDNGGSWHTTGQLIQSRVYSVTVNPGDSNKLFVGTLYGLHISYDGGDSYSFVEYTRNRTIGVIAVDPSDTSRILVGPGWRDDYDFVDNFGETSNGAGELFLSTDGGVSWSTITFDASTGTDRNVYTIQFDPSNSDNVYMGSAKGIYKSTDGGDSWTKLSDPAGTTSNRGVAVSPNGAVLYAAYATDGANRNGSVYATETDNISWTQLNGGTGETLSTIDYWYPEVDSRSTGTTHNVIISLQGDRTGLYEGTFEWASDTTLTTYAWDLIWEGQTGFDTGWDWAAPNPRYCHYTPDTWDRAIWSTTNQTIFQGEYDGSDWSWNNKYSDPNMSFTYNVFSTDFNTYSGRGTESTYTYDIVVDSNYVIQGQADNGLVESWDNGVSWMNMQRFQGGLNLTDVQSVAIGDASGTPVVLAQATTGFGGNAANGRLYAKKLVNHSTADTWQFIAGGPDEDGGIPSGVFRDIAVAPSNPSKVFIHSTNNGLYMIEDIGDFLNSLDLGGTPEAEKIMDATTYNVLNSRKISVHPTNEDIVFLSSNSGDQGVWRGDKNGSNWIWTKLLDGGGWDAEVSAWIHSGTVYLLYQGKDGTQWDMKLSTDEGLTWTTIMTPSLARELVTHDWYDEISSEYDWASKGGSVGFKDNIFVNFHDHTFQVGYGMFRGQIQGDGSIHWEDWSGDLAFKGFTSAFPYTDPDDGKDYLFVSTSGAGGWVREINTFGGSALSSIECSAESSGGAPNPPCNVTGVVVNNRTVDLTWTDNSDNEDSFEFNKFLEGDQWRGAGSNSANDNTRTVGGLDTDARFNFRVRARNGSGNSDWVESGWFDLETGEALDEFTILGSASANGTISSEGLTTVLEGDDLTYTFTPDEDYEIENVLVDGVSVGTGSSYTFTDIDSSHTISVSFVLPPPSHYQVIASAGVHGMISPQDTIMVPTGTDQTFTITAFTGYEIDEVTVDGTPVGAVSTYEFDSVVEEHMISATFSLIPEDGFGDCSATSAAGIPNPPCDFKVEVLTSNRVELTWTDNSSDETQFEFNRFLEGDQWRGSGSEGTDATSRILSGLTADTTYLFRIRAKNGNGNSDWVETPSFIDLKANLEITSSAGPNGSISPNGRTPVASGQDQTYTITADAGYQIEKLLVDGEEVDTTSSYTFNSISEGHTISAIFSRFYDGIVYEDGSWSNGTGPTMTDNAYILDNYDSVAFPCVDLFIDDNVNVRITPNSHGNLVVTGDLENNGFLGLPSGVSLVNFGSISGDGGFAIERKTTHSKSTGKYSFIGSPTEDAKVDSLGRFVYEYDETVAFDVGGADGLNNYKVPAGSTLEVGRGYASAFTGTVIFDGTPNTGDLSVTVSKTDYPAADNALEGYNIIANPYPCAIDFDKFIDANLYDAVDNPGGRLVGSIWVWDDNNSSLARGTSADFLTINKLGLVGGSTKNGKRWGAHIGMAQGFFVQVASDGAIGYGSHSVYFADSMKAQGNNADSAFFRLANLSRSGLDKVKISVSDQGNTDFDEALIGFRKDATYGIDLAYDANKMNTNDGLRVYSKSIEGNNLAIQGLPLINTAVEVNFNVHTDHIGAHTIEFDFFEFRFNNGDKVMLVDVENGVSVDLKGVKSYTFNVSELDKTTSFKLSVEPAISSVSSTDILLKSYIDAGQNLTLKFDSEIDEFAVQLYDLSGNSVWVEQNASTVNGGWKKSLGKHLKGIFILSISSEEHNVIRKLVISD